MEYKMIGLHIQLQQNVYLLNILPLQSHPLCNY